MDEQYIEEICNRTFSGLQLFARDVNLGRLADKYIVGKIIKERGYTDATCRIGGMITTHRIAILSNHMADLHEYEHDSNWGLFVAKSNARFKVFDVFRIGNKIQITLLHLPETGWKLFETMALDLEIEVINKSRESFRNKLNLEPIQEVSLDEWLSRCKLPVGMDAEGNYFGLTQYDDENEEFILDKKREYLIRTFSRTKKKDYENYIVNAIWNRINNLDIKPVTQQYVKRSDGKYALLDLYFPQLNVGVECDEFQHTVNAEADKTRELSMDEMLSSFVETEDFRLIRIKAYKDILSIEQQINDAVEELKFLSNIKEYEEWILDENASDIIISKGRIEVSDRVSFNTIVEVCKCFGKQYGDMQRSYFPIGHGYIAWFPKLAIIKDGKQTSVSNGWINQLSDDWNTIYESNDDTIKILKKDLYLGMPRIVFAQRKDVLGRNLYRFLGIYQLNKEISTDEKKA